jgi:hypothetical protein
VVNDADGLAAMRALGARSLPVVAKGDRFVIAQVIRDVVDFLGLPDDTKPRLSPAELADRYLHILDTAIAQTRAMPDDQLARTLPNRPRSWRVLLHHVFQVPVAFLEMEETGAPLSNETLLAQPGDGELLTSAAIAGFGEQVRDRFRAWAAGLPARDFDATVDTYFGPTSRHEMLERTVWHSTQHVRQVGSLLRMAGVDTVPELTKADIAGLPLTEKIWDEG